MKILYISPNPNILFDARSGAGAHIRGIIDAFESNVHAVYKIIAGNEISNSIQAKGKSRWLKEIVKNIVPLTVRKFGKEVLLLLFYARLFNRVKERIVADSPDVIYIRTEYLDFNPILLKKFNIPIVVEVNGIIWEDMKELYKSPLWRIGKIIELKKYRISDCIFAIGGLKELIGKFGIKEDKIFSIENGVTRDFSIDGNKIKHLQKKYKIPNKVIVGFVGNILKWHRLEYLVLAAEEILKKKGNVHYLIVGGGRQKDIIIRMVQGKKLMSFFTFTGSLTPGEVNCIISIMDICMIPDTLPYSCPVKLLNYGILGKAVVAPGYPYMDKLLENKKNIMFFEPGSISDLSEKILSLIEDAKLRSYLGKNLQKEVLENYTWDKIGEKTLKIIKHIINNRKRES